MAAAAAAAAAALAGPGNPFPPLSTVRTWFLGFPFCPEVILTYHLAPLLDGFFDSGMLQAALKAKHEQQDLLSQSEVKDVVRRNIGRRLKLADY